VSSLRTGSVLTIIRVTIGLEIRACVCYDHSISVFSVGPKTYPEVEFLHLISRKVGHRYSANVCLLFVFLALQPIVVVFSQPGSGL
jgi:hypothetical protein